MVGVGRSDAVRGHLAAETDQIITAYVSALRAQGNPLGVYPDAAIANGVLPLLNTLTRTAGGVDDGAAETVGQARARAKVNPVHSMRAASILHDIIAGEVHAFAAGHDVNGADVAEVLHDLHRVIMKRVEQAAIPYARVLLHQISNAHAAERSRIAAEVHDRAAHATALALQQLEMRSILVKRGEHDAAEACLVALAENLKDASEMIRDIAHDLGSNHTEAGLEVALEKYVAANGEGRVRLHVDGDAVADVPAWVREQAFLSVREALRNAIRHSGAQTIEANLTVRDNNLIMIVRDWGAGFSEDPEGVIMASPPGKGLRSITNRVEQLGGSAVFGSRPGVGTTVELVVPLP